MRVYTDRNLKKEKCEFDIPIIDMDNAILYKEFHNPDYVASYRLSDIESGIISHNKSYYFFDHSIVDTPGGRNSIENHAYHIYPITDKMYETILSDMSYNIWRVKFDSLINFNKIYLSVGMSYGTNTRPSVQKWVYESYFKDNALYVPHRLSYARFRSGSTMDEFFEYHRNKYGERNQKLIKNNKVFRDIQLSKIFG